MEAIKLRVAFFKTKSGTEPVREWLKNLDQSEKKAIGEEIKTVQFGWPLGMPVVRKMEPNLWEVRIQLDGRIARILFTVEEEIMVLLHGFIKKTQKTPTQELKLAKQRMSILRKRK
ncbi:MAG: type II toxin-antitoxin system RelE/ParE family toxin [Magnetococcales bacterium]|nr:type II toxin-antitoxin system RelE/ParE family toxin [Magnetococcales bacterium]